MDEKTGGNLPQGVALSWGLEKSPQRGPKRELSIKQIVETAVAIADEDGLAAVSMKQVALRLGFTTMSLYRYISSKDDLLLLMQDAVCDISFSVDEDETNWREGLRGFVRATIDAFRKHPWFGDIPISGVPITPNQLKLIDHTLKSLHSLPLNNYEKMSIVLLLSSYARSSGSILKDMDQAIKAGKSPGSFSGKDYSSALKELVTPERFPYLSPVILSGAYTEENEEENTVGDDFDFGLERILDGIEHYLSFKKGD